MEDEMSSVMIAAAALTLKHKDREICLPTRFIGPILSP